MKAFLVKHLKIIITFIVALIFSIIVFAVVGGFHFVSTKETMKDLCDAFSIPGFLLAGFGILVFISNDGGFSMLSYSIKRIFAVFKKDPKMEDFYEYKKRKVENPSPFKHYLIIGGMFFLIGMIFLIIFSLLK